MFNDKNNGFLISPSKQFIKNLEVAMDTKEQLQQLGFLAGDFWLFLHFFGAKNPMGFSVSPPVKPPVETSAVGPQRGACCAVPGLQEIHAGGVQHRGADLGVHEGLPRSAAPEILYNIYTIYIYV